MSIRRKASREPSSLYRRHFLGDGGMNALLAIALPMIASSATELIMMTVDRVFLSRLGPVHMAASSSGGLMALMTGTFFFGVIGYSTALVAQHLGAGQKRACALAAHQGFVVSAIAYPIALLTMPLWLYLLSRAGHHPEQQILERQYYTILVCGSCVSLGTVPIRCFFTGVGRTTVVMGASFIAMGVNIAANYLLIFGKLGFPALGIRGAAVGTVIGNACGALYLLSVYLSRACRTEFAIADAVRISWPELRKLLKYGTPSGVEFLLNMGAFTFFVQLFHSYGADAAAAMTITLQWDMFAFFPMLGLSMGTTSLVGRYMGARCPDLAERAAYSGLKAALCYSGIAACVYLLVPGPLVRVFAVSGRGFDYSGVVPLAETMVRLAALYVVCDATAIVLGGALRGAGDTQWCMRVSVCIHWSMALCGYVMIRRLQARPVAVWLGFVALVVLMGTVYFGRFRRGRWKSLCVLGESVSVIPLGEAQPETAELLGD